MQSYLVYSFLFITTTGYITKRDAEAGRMAPNKANEMCLMDNELHCNTHNPRLTCTCFRPDDNDTPLQYVSCDDKFRIVNYPKNIVRIKTALSARPRALEYVDELLAEVLWKTCEIPKSHIYILRKSCDADAMYIYMGIFSDPEFIDYNEIGPYDVRMVLPEMLYSNAELREQKILPILGIDQVIVIPPIQCPICKFLKAKEILDRKADILGVPKLNLSWLNEPSGSGHVAVEGRESRGDTWIYWEDIFLPCFAAVSVSLALFAFCRRLS